MTGPRSTARRGMIPPGPRTVARRERAEQLRAAWNSLPAESRALLRRMDHPTRAAILHKIVNDQAGST